MFFKAPAFEYLCLQALENSQATTLLLYKINKCSSMGASIFKYLRLEVI